MSAGSAGAVKGGIPIGLAKAAVAVALTFAAGYVDAMGWLALDRVFTAQMSGHLMLLAVHIVANEKGHIALQANAIIAFFVGLVMTGSIIEIGMRRRWRRIFVAALVVEFLLLLSFVLAGSAVFPAGSHERGERRIGRPMP